MCSFSDTFTVFVRITNQQSQDVRLGLDKLDNELPEYVEFPFVDIFCGPLVRLPLGYSDLLL